MLLNNPELKQPIAEALKETGNPVLARSEDLKTALQSYGFSNDFIASNLMEIASSAKYSVRRQMILDLMALCGTDIRRSEGEVSIAPQINIILDSNVQLNQMFNPDRNFIRKATD